MDGKSGAFRIVCRVAYYGIIILIVLFVVYSFLNWLTLFLWGDSSALRGEPRMFHPPQIVILHYTSMISPELGKIIVALLFSGCAFFTYLGYRQLTRKNSLDHPTRNKIAGCIRSHPGCHFGSIMRASGINRGTLSYHLGQLAALGLVHEVRVRGMTRYFMQGCARSALEEALLIHRNNSVRSRILDMLEHAPTVTRTELKKGLGISGPALWYHMQLLIRDGIVREIQAPEQIGRPVRYALAGPAREIAEKMRGALGSLAGAGMLSDQGQGEGTLAGQ
ncbi:winged helix-turn-helix transcriptional regulator [Methanoregula sp.]|uniref:winged helix-turn-helix transcriptional regulator n=1 Tax=Methanoregula sp. TaxID=2052170 RepID=UPI00356A18CD